MSFQRSKLSRDGTSQPQRYHEALGPTYIQIDEHRLEDFVHFVQQFAGELAYYDITNNQIGSWTPFFENLQELAERQELRNDIPAHSTLMLTFLRLLNIVKNDLNTLQLKHLLFYYQDVLRFQKKDLTPDRVHILFQLVKNVEKGYLLKGGTKLRAGKDSAGNELFYATTKDIVLNNTVVESLKTIFVDVDNQHRIYAAPIANSLDGIGASLEPDQLGWHTFGEKQIGKAPEERSMVDARVGFAFASPILLLQEGDRNITLTLSFAGTDPLIHIEDEDLADAFRAFASGEEVWIEPAISLVSKIDNNNLEIVLLLGVTDPAFIAYNQEVLELPLHTKFPVLQILLNHEADTFRYDELKDLNLNSYRITVDVDGVRNLILQNEDGLIDRSNSFYPFGAQPHVGSHFYFGSYEVFQKEIELDSLILHLHLANKPYSIFVHYSNYPSHYSNHNRTINQFILLDGNWIEERSDIPLFDIGPDPIVGPPTYPIIQNPIERILQVSDYFIRNPKMEKVTHYTPSTLRGFGRLTLNAPDFGHQIYPTELTIGALIPQDEGGPQIPNQPYTPEIQSISLDYSSSITIQLGQESEYEQFFHIEPFGCRERPHLSESVLLLPQYQQGNLYIGLNDFTPPQNLSMLFQQLEGSANPDVSVNRDNIHWEYLSKNDWIPFEGLSIQSDTTLGLQTSGLIEYTIGKNASSEHTVLPSGLHWLRAMVDIDPSGINRIIDIHAQAAAATFTSGNQSSEHLLIPLLEGKISKMVTPSAAVKKISQPYASFGGSPLERDHNLIRRVSERLRHKQRGITIWDYERLALEAFPELYKVKCLNHADRSSETSPGNITLLTIPNLRNQNAVNPLQPKASSVLRDKVKNYLGKYLSFFSRLEVQNPIYEEIIVEAKVGLHEGYDGGYYGALLNEELKRFLSPWAFEEGRDIVFGGRIYKSHILKFMEDRPYVDYITDFELLHIQRGLGIGSVCIGIDFFVAGINGAIAVFDYARASTERSILVSGEEHSIEVLEPGQYVCSTAVIPTGIGAMIIEGNFVTN